MATTNFIPQMWAAALLENYHAQAIVTPTTNREYEGIASRGNQVNITQITTPTVVDYAGAGRTINPEDLADTQIPLLIDQEKATAFNVDDVDRVQAAGSFEPVTRDSSQALVEDAESFIVGRMTTNGTNANADTTPRSFDNPQGAFDEVMQLRTALSTNKVPAANRWLAANPEFTRHLLGADSKLVEVDTSGMNEGLRNAVVGRLLGFNVVETPLLNPGTPTIVGYHQNAVAYVNQIDNVETLRNQTKFADIVRMLHVYGSKITRTEAVQYSVSGG